MRQGRLNDREASLHELERTLRSWERSMVEQKDMFGSAAVEVKMKKT